MRSVNPRQGNGWSFPVAPPEPERGGRQGLAKCAAQRPTPLTTSTELRLPPMIPGMCSTGGTNKCGHDVPASRG